MLTTWKQSKTNTNLYSATQDTKNKQTNFLKSMGKEGNVQGSQNKNYASNSW